MPLVPYYLVAPTRRVACSCQRRGSLSSASAYAPRPLCLRQRVSVSQFLRDMAHTVFCSFAPGCTVCVSRPPTCISLRILHRIRELQVYTGEFKRPRGRIHTSQRSSFGRATPDIFVCDTLARTVFLIFYSIVAMQWLHIAFVPHITGKGAGMISFIREVRRSLAPGEKGHSILRSGYVTLLRLDPEPFPRVESCSPTGETDGALINNIYRTEVRC